MHSNKIFVLHLEAVFNGQLLKSNFTVMLKRWPKQAGIK